MVNSGTNNTLRRPRPEDGLEDVGATKKQKVDESLTSTPGSSFAEVLKQFKEAEQSPVEGGADKWERAPLTSPIDPETDSIVFQQIDIVKGKGGIVRMFGITEEGHTVLALITCRTRLESVKSFMKDANLVGMSWVEIPATKYQLVANYAKISRCQIEITTRYDFIISHIPIEGSPWSRNAPIRILSFDLECTIRGEAFPDSSKDPVIQITNMVTQYGKKKPFIRTVFAVDSCADISGAEVKTFKTEKDLLEAWSDFVRTVDPDLLIGYNIFDFDLRFLVDRAKLTGAKEFSFLSRVVDSQASYGGRQFSMNIKGSIKDVWVKYTPLEGQLQLDIQRFLQREVPLNSGDRPYSLRSVSHHFLQESKEDLQFKEITPLFRGNEFDRRKLAVYCLKDTYLPQQLLDKVDAFSNYVEKARAEVGTLFNDLLFRPRRIEDVASQG